MERPAPAGQPGSGSIAVFKSCFKKHNFTPWPSTEGDFDTGFYFCFYSVLLVSEFKLPLFCLFFALGVIVYLYVFIEQHFGQSCASCVS